MQEDAIRAAKDLAELKAQRQGFALQPDVFTPVKLVRREDVTADSRCVKQCIGSSSLPRI